MGTSLNGLTPAGTYPGLIKTGDNAPIDGTLKTLSDGNGNNLPMAVSTTAVNFTNQLQQGGVAVPTASQVNAKQDTLVSGTNIKTINGTSVLGSGDIVTPYTPPSGVAGAIQFSNGSAFASDATNLFWDDTNNRLGVGTNAPDTTAHFKGGVAGSVGVRVATFEGNLPEILFKDTNNNTGFAIAKYGQIVYFVNTNASGGYSSYSGLTNNNSQWSFGGGFNPSGTVHIKGGGSTSATTSLLVQNSGGSNALKITDDLNTSLGGSLTIQRDATNFTMRLGNLGQINAYIDATQTNQFHLVDSTFSNTFTLNDVGISFGGTPTASAKVSVNSTTQGFLPPRMTTTQRDAIATPATGLNVYNTTTNTTDTYDGTTWQRFGQQTFIKGSGSTSATTSLLVQNSSGSQALKVDDSLRTTVQTLNVLSTYPSLYIGSANMLDYGDGLRVGYDAAVTKVTLYTNGGTPQLQVNNSGQVSVGTTSPNASAKFQIDSTTLGFLPPRMTTTQKNAISSPASGLVVYDSTTNKLCCYDGSTWNDLF